MPVNKTIAPLSLKLNPSVCLQRFNICIHLLALAALLYTPINWIIQAALTCLIAVDYRFNETRIRNENREIHYQEKTGWSIVSEGKVNRVQILSSTVLTPWLIFLHTKELAPSVIVRDALAKEDFRRLLVKLKITWAHQE